MYSETGRERDGKGLVVYIPEVSETTIDLLSFVEFETAADLRTAVEKLDGREFKGARVSCIPDVSSLPSTYPLTQYLSQEQPQEERPRERLGRSRSPPGRRGYPPAGDEYDRRGPPRGYSPRRHDYRDRSPRRDYYDARYRSPPRGLRAPPDDYPPPRRPYPEDPYDARAPLPRRGGYEPDPYLNGHDRPYDRPPRPRSPGRVYGGYDERPRYW